MPPNMYAEVFLKDIRQLKRIRTILGLTQKKLASRARVSQSLIAKIETGRIDPSYRCVMDIYKAIAWYERSKSGKKGFKDLTVGEVCNRNLVSFKVDDDLVTAAKEFKNKGISQAPVMDENGRVVGTVRDLGMLDNIFDKLHNDSVGDVMEPPLPVVDASMPLEAVRPLIKFRYAVLVSEKGQIVGILTPHDLI